MADDSISIYDEIEIEDMTFDPAMQIYHFPCPCGDRFEITIDDLRDGEEIAVCPSCSLMIKVFFDLVCELPRLLEVGMEGVYTMTLLYSFYFWSPGYKSMVECILIVLLCLG